jgi:ABC-type transporter Mla subunit MlaD
MNDRAMKLRLGLFVLIALIFLGTLIVLFGSLPTWFRPSTLYTVRFTDAPGVNPGTPVRRSGVRIGAVRDVVLDDERGIVRVQLAIDPRFTLRRNEQPTLITGLLGSDASIDFVPQTPEEGQPVDRSPVEPGAELVGTRQASVNTLLNRASEVVPTTQETLNDMRKSIQRLERMAPLAEDTMREYRDLARSLRDSLPDLRRTNREVGDLARTAREAVPDVRRAVEDAAALSRTWNRLGERLDTLLQTNQDRIIKSIENLNDVLARASSLLSDENTRNVTAIIKNSRLASDRFDDITRNLDALVKDGRRTAERFNGTLDRADVVLDDMRKVSKPMADRADAMARNLDASLANTAQITGPLAQRADPIARNLDADLDLTRRVLAPIAPRSEHFAQNLDQSSERLNRVLADVEALMRVLDQSNGTLRLFLVDPSLYIHLDQAICALGKQTPWVERILRDFEVFADKLARHPEALGLGGVVRPGSGLKDPPTYPQPLPVVVPPPPPHNP